MLLDPIKEFSRHAHTYDAHTQVQKEVARYLLSPIQNRPQKVLDLGCGSGAIYQMISWHMDSFTAVDCSKQMLEKHPRGNNIHVVCEDFDVWETSQRYDLIVSSSALQWSNNLPSIIERMAHSCTQGAFAVFTDKTFETLYRLSGRKSFLPEAKTLLSSFEEHFTCKHEVRNFTQHFPDTLSLFRHIKRSGVSGGEKVLSVAKMKKLIHEYPHSFLEFEVLFVWGVSKKKPLCV